MYAPLAADNAPTWWRGRYEIVDGLVRPTSAPEKYSFSSSKHIRGREPRPYAALLRLAHRAAYDRHHKPTSQTTEEILAWCNRYGLLGLLLHHTVLVRPWPRWRPRIDPQGEHGLLIPGRVGHVSAKLVPIAQQFVRQGGSWLAVYEVLSPKKLGSATPRKPGPLEPDDVLDWREPGVAVAGSGSGHAWQSIAAAWGRFFPGIPDEERERYPYPKPLSPEFWRLYAEPVGDFLDAAVALRDEVAARRPKNRAASKEHQEGSESARARVTRPSESAPSLVAILSAMIAEDLQAGYRADVCAECGAPFLSDARRVRYCSPTCRNTSVVRAYRHRLKKKRRGPPRRR